MKPADLQELYSLAKGVDWQRMITLSTSPSTLSDLFSKIPALPDLLNKLNAGEALDDSGVSTLEELIVGQVRPILPMRDGHFEVPATWLDPALAASHERVVIAAAAVGRIDVSQVPGVQFAGTGFLVAPDLVMTTRGVAELFANGLGRSGLSIKPGRRPRLVFDSQTGDALDGIPVTEIVLIHPLLDLALVRIEPSGGAPLRFSTASAYDAIGRPVAVVGHVAFDTGRNPAAVAKVTAGLIGTKHIAPGFVTPADTFERYGRQLWALTHDCTALAGSAGGPVIDLATGVVIGLQVSAKGYASNYAIPGRDLARDSRVASFLTFEGAVESSSSVWQEYWLEADPEEAPVSKKRHTPQNVVRPDTVLSQVNTLFPDAAGFASFLMQHGYKAVVDAVPTMFEGVDYLRALLSALERRGLLDTKLVEAFQQIGAPTALVLPIANDEGAIEAPDLNAAAAIVEMPVAVPAATPAGAASPAVAPPSPPPPPPAAPAGLSPAGVEAPAALPVATAIVGPPVPSPSEGLSVDVAYLSRGMEARRGVVLVQLEENRFGCTGWLLTPELVVVPAHLFTGVAKIKEKASVRVTARLDFDNAESIPDTRAISHIEFLDATLDLCLLRLKDPVTDRQPLRINPEPIVTDFLSTIHHPQLGPKRLSIGGALLAIQPKNVVYRMATEPGSAGSPVFDRAWRVVATHRQRQQYQASIEQPSVQAKSGTSTIALLEALRERFSQARLWREIVAAQPDLKAVDASLRTPLAVSGKDSQPAKVPLLIEVLDESVSLEGVPGLVVRSKGNCIITAFGTTQTVAALAERSDVLSVRSSPAAGTVECARSIPHIGAVQVQTVKRESGSGSLIAVIDNGADVFHQALRNTAQQTRVVVFWDQKDSDAVAGVAKTISREGAAFAAKFGLKYGAVYVREDLDRIISGQAARPQPFPGDAQVEHGTVVCSIAAGRRVGPGADDFMGGVAPEAELIVIRYDLRGASIGYADSHIDSLRFINDLAKELDDKPVVVNISNGMNAGAHDGTSFLEQACEGFTANGTAIGRVIVKSAGNERGQGRHAMVQPSVGAAVEIRWDSRPAFPGANPIADIVEVWFDAKNEYVFRLRSPTGEWSPPIQRLPVDRRKLDEFLPNGNRVTAELTPSRTENGDGSLRLDIQPGQVPEVQTGEWALEVEAVSINGSREIHAWVEDRFQRLMRFVDGLDDRVTVTIPGTAAHVITVGAIEVADKMRPYKSSSVGPARKGTLEKPELVAPGVDVRGARAGSSVGIALLTSTTSGTSFAAPHVAGAIALVFSARAKAGLPQLNAKQIRVVLFKSLRHFTPTWDNRTGYGELNALAFFEEAMAL